MQLEEQSNSLFSDQLTEGRSESNEKSEVVEWKLEAGLGVLTS